MDYKATAEKIYSAIGGKENLNRAFHCATRLRLELKDVKKADTKAIDNIKGIAGTNIAGNQLQVIIGTDVTLVYKELEKIADLKGNEDDAPKEKEGIISLIAGIFTPIIPAIIGGGMIKALLALIAAFSLMKTTSQTYLILSYIGNAPFYFLPFLIGYTSSKKFHTNSFISMALAGVLLTPELATLGGKAGTVAFMGIPVVIATYSSSVIPIILTVWLQSYVERFFEHIWKPVRSFLKPTLTLLLVAPIMLIAIGPLGTWCGGAMADGLIWINNTAPWLPPVLMGAFSPLIVMTGMHYSLIPLAISQVTTVGYITIDLPGMLAANVAQGGAALCVAIKTKSLKMKELAASSGFTAVLGITEPAMYGVNLKLKRPFMAVMIGGACGGLYAGLSGLKAFAPGAPGLATLPIFIGGSNPMGNLINAVITIVIAFVVAFIAAWILGFEDVVEAEEPNESSLNDDTVEKLNVDLSVYAPVKGKVMPLHEVNDTTFASGMMGKGCAIMPEADTIYAPCNGTITSLFPSKHAVGITSDEGVELLIHIGLNTVKLDGTGFDVLVKQGDIVKKGDKIVKFDLKGISAKGYDMVTPVIVLNSDAVGSIVINDSRESDNSKVLFTVK